MLLSFERGKNIEQKGRVPDINLEFSPLKRDQMPKVIALLQEISNFEPSPDSYDKIWSDYSAQQNVVSIVATHMNGTLVGFGTLVLETKIRGGRLGHIEDIVTHPDYVRLGVGASIVEHLSQIAQDNECYKVALHCKEHNVEFYRKSGFVSSGSALQRLL